MLEEGRGMREWIIFIFFWEKVEKLYNHVFKGRPESKLRRRISKRHTTENLTKKEKKVL
jgi:hypothetical protein